MFKRKFADNLRNIRKSRKMTQEMLADLVDVDFRYISLIENAKNFPSCDLIEKLASARNVTYSELFSFEENVSRKDLEKNLIKVLRSMDDKNLKILYNIAKNLF